MSITKRILDGSLPWPRSSHDDEESSAAAQVALDVFARLEKLREQPYSSSYRGTLMSRLRDEGRTALREIGLKNPKLDAESLRAAAADRVFEARRPRARRPSGGERRGRFRGSPVRVRHLYEPGEIDGIKERIRGTVEHELVFADELRTAGGSTYAERERKSQSGEHDLLTATMRAVLDRLGYVALPIGVGLRGTHCLADLVAVDPETRSVVLFECLTKASIKLGQHETKRPLIEEALRRRISFCFVGSVPADFLQQYPEQTVYAIADPVAATTVRGKWVPPFYAREGAECRLVVSVQPKKKLTKLSFAMPGLRLSEDVSGFLWSALWPATMKLRSGIWKVKKHPRRLGGVPFDRDSNRTTLGIETPDGDNLVIRFGAASPIPGTIRGQEAFVDWLETTCRESGLPVQVDE